MEPDPTLSSRAIEIESGLRKILDRHGHVFHHRVLSEIEALSTDRDDPVPWRFVGAEIPVSVQDFNTHIDFVLGRTLKLNYEPPDMYLVAECKRVNPALGDWCFVRAPFTWASERPGCNLEKVVRTARGGAHTGVTQTFVGASPYHIGVELRGGKKGDDGGRARGLQDAVTQACLAAQGFAAVLCHRADVSLVAEKATPIIPAVVTTAELWTSDIVISNADLATGELRKEAALNPVSVPWLWYEWNVSPTIRHAVPRLFDEGRGLHRALQDEHTRVVAVVSATGLKTFLEQWWHE